MKIRNRIRELRTVRAGDLVPNPRNWRTHPQAQQDALRGILAEIGYADALLARELPDGALMLVDGHLRAETTPDAMVPVLILDINEDEANKLLLLLDPLAAMAEANKEALGQLLLENQSENAAMQAMLDGLAAENGIDPFADGAEGGAGEPPESNYQEQYGVIVLCTDEANQQAVYEKLAADGYNCKVVVT
jgi:ParB-like chromosome segregation protein Spo0J